MTVADKNSAESSSASRFQAMPPGMRGRSGADWRPALSASRAKEYLKCPLQFRLHVVDGIKEPPTQATTLGTLFHSVVESLFDVPAQQRTPEYAQSLVAPLWASMLERHPEVESIFKDPQDREQWLQRTYEMVATYFNLENPQFLEPAQREAHIVAQTPDGLWLRGFIDRVDRSAQGALRVVDYKTGKAPSARYQDDALYQMRFYALLLMLTDKLPARTQLLYVKAGKVLTFDPTYEEIERFRQELFTLWRAIEADAQRGHFAPRRNPLCQWCGVQSLCPLFGGVSPSLPDEGVKKLLSMCHTV